MSARACPAFTVVGTINGSWTSDIVRDTGCDCIIASEEAVPDADVSSCLTTLIQDFLGRVSKFLVVNC